MSRDSDEIVHPSAPTVATGVGSSQTPTELGGAVTDMAAGAVTVARTLTQVDRYVLLGRVGSGGMGVVYRAYDPELDRKVAIKLLAVAGPGATALRDRLLREGQALAKVSHPNVVAIHDVGRAGDDVFIAMELVEGPTLREWISDKRHTTAEILELFLAAGQGLAAAHRAGLVHRDFKPENVVVDKAGQPRVLDFGIARATVDSDADPSLDVRPLDPTIEAPAFDAIVPESGQNMLQTPLTRAGDRLGTPLYMAPEQHDGQTVDERADQFAFAVALWEALYKVLPYAAVTHSELIAKLRRGRPDAPPPGTAVAPWLRGVLERALAADPATRYASMRELLAALLAGIDRQRARPIRRRWIVAAALAATGGLTIGAIALRRASESSTAPVCEADPTSFTGIWDEPTRQVLHTSFAATGLGYSEDSFGLFSSGADTYVASLVEARRDACVASRIRHELSEDAYVRRSACIDERRASLAAVVHLLRTADKDQVKNAPTAFTLLPPVADCADVVTLENAPARPTELTARARLAQYETRLEDVIANYTLGRATQAMASATETLATLTASGFSYAPLEASLHYWRGRAAADLADPSALSELQSEFARGIAANNWYYAADGAARVAQELMFAHRLDDYAAWDQIARAALERHPFTPVTQFVDQVHCMSLFWTGKNQSRLRCMRALIAPPSARKRDEWVISMLGIAAFDAGEAVEALGYLKESVATATRTYGAFHPRTFEMRAYLAQGYIKLGDDAAAERETADALASLQRVAPEETSLAARLSLNRARALIGLHREKEAAPLLALAIGNPETKAEALGVRSSMMGKEDPPRTLAAAREALAADLAQFPPNHPNVIVDRRELMRACLVAHDVPCAKDALAPLDGVVDESELNPIDLAALEYSRGNLARETSRTRPDVRAHYARCVEILQPHPQRSADADRHLADCTAAIAKLDSTK